MNHNCTSATLRWETTDGHNTPSPVSPVYSGVDRADRPALERQQPVTTTVCLRCEVTCTSAVKTSNPACQMITGHSTAMRRPESLTFRIPTPRLPPTSTSHPQHGKFCSKHWSRKQNKIEGLTTYPETMLTTKKTSINWQTRLKYTPHSNNGGYEWKRGTHAVNGKYTSPTSQSPTCRNKPQPSRTD